VSYMKWIGAGASRTIPVAYARTEPLAYLDRPADTTRGRAVYLAKCQSCHGVDGAGAMDSARVVYVYPPLWGAHSYNVGAGMYQLSKLAGFVKNNMPFGVTRRAPQLTDEQAWDVAAFVDSRPRPSADLRAEDREQAGGLSVRAVRGSLHGSAAQVRSVCTDCGCAPTGVSRSMT
jgi:thiosulfate dehydrogenase